MALQDNQFIKYNIENKQAFNSVLKKAADQVSDLRFPLGEISRDFYKSERAIFLLKGPGGYTDLNKQYKKEKMRAVGFVYPILKRSGRLEKAATSPNAPGSINRIGKKDLIIGASVMSKGKKPIDIVSVHDSDSDRKKIPQRKIIFIGPEVKAFHAKDRQNKGGRLTRWGFIVERYVQTVLKQQGLS